MFCVLLGVTMPVAGVVLEQTVVVAASGDPSPDGNGLLSGFSIPISQDENHVAFLSSMEVDGRRVGVGLFSADATLGNLLIRTRLGDPTPNLDGNLAGIGQLKINRMNQVAFAAELDNVLDPLSIFGIFLSDVPPGDIVQLARSNQITSDDERLTPSLFGYSFNDAGQAAFTTSLLTPTSVTFAISRAEGLSGTLTEIVRLGQNVPSGGVFTMISAFAFAVSINDLGQVLFSGGVSNSGENYSGLFYGDGSNITEVIRSGSLTPSGNGTLVGGLNGFNAVFPAFNDMGEAAVVSLLRDTNLGLADNVGLFRSDGVNLTEIVRKSDLLPDGTGRFQTIDLNITLNNMGQVLFTSTISGGQSNSDAGIFIGDGQELTQIARIGDTVPGEGGVFSGFDLESLALNHSGQAAFIAETTLQTDRGPRQTTGLFFHDPEVGLRPVARVGDTLPDRGVITGLHFNGGLLFIGEEGSGLNDQGQVTYRFQVDGGTGIAIWTIPAEPLVP